MIKIQAIETDVTNMSHNEIVEKFGEVYGFKTKNDRTIVQVGYILTY